MRPCAGRWLPGLTLRSFFIVADDACAECTIDVLLVWWQMVIKSAEPRRTGEPGPTLVAWATSATESCRRQLSLADQRLPVLLPAGTSNALHSVNYQSPWCSEARSEGRAVVSKYLIHLVAIARTAPRHGRCA